MGGIDKDLHWPWLGFALEQAMEKGLAEPKDVVQHATAEVLVSQLPHDVLIALLSRALATEQLTPQIVLDTAAPSLLAEHLEPDVMWRCLRDVADRTGLSARDRTRTPEARSWLAAILQGALETELISPADLMRHLPPSEFVKDTPLPVMAELIKAGLLGGKFDPALVIQHLTPTVIADHLESSLVWGSIKEAVVKKFELEAAPAAEKPPRETAHDEEHTGKFPVAAPAKKHSRKDALPKIEAVAPRRAAAGGSKLPHPDDWGATDDLDVVEEQPLPPPPMVRGKA